MKKILSVLASAVMAISLFACATAAPKADLPVATKTYKFEVVNATSNTVIAIMCVVPAPFETGDCLFTPMVLFPKSHHEKDAKMPYKVTLNLKPGTYAFLILGKDLRTGEEGYQKIVGSLEGDGQLIFMDKGTAVRNV